MSRKTERLNVLLSPEEKTLIEEQATATGLSVSELLRRGALAYDPESDEAALLALSEEASAAIDRMMATLDRTLDHLERTRLTEAELEAIRKDARDEYARRPFVLAALAMEPAE